MDTLSKPRARETIGALDDMVLGAWRIGTRNDENVLSNLSSVSVYVDELTGSPRKDVAVSIYDIFFGGV